MAGQKARAQGSVARLGSSNSPDVVHDLNDDAKN